MKNSVSIAAALVVLSTLGSAQSASDVLEENALVWLDPYSRMEYPADLDGDGRDELVGWWSYWSDHGSLQVFFWSQDAASAIWTELEDTFGSQDYAYGWGCATGVGDFDADGKDEVVLMNHWAIELFEPNGAGLPVRVVNQDYPQNISALDRDCVVADFDEDGRDDVALTAGDTLYLFRSVPGGFDLVDSHTFEGSLVRLSVAAADAAWDAAELEVVVLQDLPVARVWVFGVDSVLQLRETAPYDLQPGAGGGAGVAVMLTSGDVDGDGDTDLVAFGATGSYQVLRRGGPGYTVEAPRGGGPATALADINGDGHLDGICCGGGGGGSFTHNDQPSTFEICMGDGTGNFDSSVQFVGIGGHHVAGAMDFDGDGDMDVLGGRAVLLGKSSLAAHLCDGAMNSTGSAAVLEVAGSHSLSKGGPTFLTSGLPAGAATMLVASLLVEPANLISLPFFDGNLCLQPGLGRLKFAYADEFGVADHGGVDGWGWTPWNLGQDPGSMFGYRVWYRDPAAGGTGANLSSALSVQLVD